MEKSSEKRTILCTDVSQLRGEKLLKHFHDIYEQKVQSSDSIEKQNALLRRWVRDLEVQNALLTKSVKDMEREGVERARSMAVELKKKIEKDSSEMERLKIRNENLQEDVSVKESEIDKLIKESQARERTISELEVNLENQRGQGSIPQKTDVEVFASLCCSNNEREEPVKDVNVTACQEEMKKYKEEIARLESQLQEIQESERCLKRNNTQMYDDMATLRGVCTALKEQCHTCEVHAQFKDDIIKEMRRQLKQAKAKLKEESISINIQKQALHEICGGDYTLNRSLSDTKTSRSSRSMSPSKNAVLIKNLRPAVDLLDRGDNANIPKLQNNCEANAPSHHD